ncbi:MAG: sigma-70 family RNA polymerase sigma factor, partial [Myxococcota bacterium]
LVAAAQPLVRRIAHRHRGPGCALHDLVQEGNVGLLAAIDRFDPDRGVRLATYAAWWVRAYVLRFVERNARLVRGATTSDRLRLFYQLGRTTQQLAAEGRETGPAAVAEALGVDERDVVAMQMLRAPAASLDAPSEGEGRPRVALDRLADTSDSPEQWLESEELRERLDDALDRFGATLHGRSLEMFRDRVRSPRPASLHELSQRWGVTRPAARRIEDRVSRPLRRFLYREMGDAITAALGSV